MRKSIRNILLILLVAILGVSTFLLLKESDEIKVEEEKTELILVKEVTDEVMEMSLKNPNGEFTFIKQSGVWKNVFKNNEATYGNTIVALESIVKATSAVELIEKDVKVLSKYGLDNPTAVLNYKTATGMGYIKIGNDVVGTKYYFTVDGKDVYTMDYIESALFLSGMGAFTKLALISTQISNVERVEIKNSNLIVIEKKTEAELSDGSADSLFTYTLREPVVASASATAMEPFLRKVSEITAKNYDPNMSDALAGISSSSPYVRVKTKGSDVKLYLGAGDSEYIYAKREGESGIYQISADLLSFMEVSAFELVDKHIKLYYYEEISRIVIDKGEKRFDLVLGTNPSLNGNAISEDEARDHYKNIISLSYDGEGEMVSDSAEVIITFFEASGVRIVRLTPYDALSYSVVIDGDSAFTIKRKYIDKLLDLLS